MKKLEKIYKLSILTYMQIYKCYIVLDDKKFYNATFEDCFSH